MYQELFGEKYRTQSVRLKHYDYSGSGFYFVTICTKDREEFFGEVKNGVMVLNEIGRVAAIEWRKTGEIRENVNLHEWVVMPNHFHGIVEIDNSFSVEAPIGASTELQVRLYGIAMRLYELQCASTSWGQCLE